MAPSALSRQEQHREANKDQVLHYETEVLDDATTPMDQARADYLFQMVKNTHTDIHANHKSVLELSPPNSDDQRREYSQLLKRITTVMAAFAGITARFVPATPASSTAHHQLIINSRG